MPTPYFPPSGGGTSDHAALDPTSLVFADSAHTGPAYNIPYFGAGGVATSIAPGADGTVLTSSSSTWTVAPLPSAPVTSVFGRTAAVVAMAGDYTAAEVGAIDAAARGATDGVASLDGTTKVPTAQLGTGTAGGTNWLRGDRSWATPTAAQVGAISSGTLTSNGDSMYYALGTYQRLAIGSTGQHLTVVGGYPAWVSTTITQTIIFIISGGGSAITTGSKGFIAVDYAATITGATLLADQSGSIVVDIQSGTYAAFPTNSSICAAAKPTLSAAQKSQNTTLTGWTTSITAGNILEFVVDSASTVTQVTVVLTVTRSI